MHNGTRASKTAMKTQVVRTNLDFVKSSYSRNYHSQSNKGDRVLITSNDVRDILRTYAQAYFNWDLSFPIYAKNGTMANEEVIKILCSPGKKL